MLFPKRLLLSWISIFMAGMLLAQDPGDVRIIPVQDRAESVVAAQVRQANESGLNFYRFDGLIPSQKTEDLRAYSLRTASMYALDFNQLTALLRNAPEAVSFSFRKKDGKTLHLDLVRVRLLDEQFVVNTSGNGQADYTPGLYYQGVVNGQSQHLAAISFFEDQVIGMISLDDHNLVFQPSRAHYGHLLLYDDRDIYASKGFECRADELENSFRNDQNPDLAESAPGDCIRAYIECDYALNQNKGGVSNTVNWITAVYNNVKTLYTNESINTTISEVFVWTTADTYSKTNSVTALNQFRNLRGTFNGDLAHLAALGGQNIGGVAWLDVLCTSYKYAYSNISSSYADVPTYSWTVEVMTHEMGHNIGSNHTQWCGWSGGALDNCYTPEGNCQPGPPPNNGGTIMSYCHLTQYGINFNNGFGVQPGDKIRNRVAAATCLGTSCGGGGDCGVPTGLNISNITNTTANAAWNTVSGATSYKFEYKKSTDQTWTEVTTTNPNYSMTGLTAGTQYNTRVKAVCSSGESTYSAQVNFTTTGGGGGCGTPTNLAVSNITTTTATVTWGAVSGATAYHFQYKLASSGTWQQATVYSTTVNMTNMTPNTTYNVRVRAVCGSTNGSFTATVSFTTLSAGYCNSKGNNANYEWVARVKLGTIDRISGKDGGYYNGTGLVTDLNKGTSYTINYQAGTSGSSGTLYWRVWIDYNRDNDFLDAGEQVVSVATASTSLLATTFTVPTGAATGTARMRVSVKYGGFPTSCETFSYGEVEDYTVNLKVAGTLISGESSVRDLEVYPNPFNGYLFMDYESATDREITVSILDLMGRTQHSSIHQVLKGKNTLEISSENLAPASYLVKVENGEEVKIHKVIKSE